MKNLIKEGPGLEADGMIDVYEIETGKVVAQYEGLEVHEKIERIKAVLDIIKEYGGYDGGRHKQWVLDQVVRTLLGCNEEYFNWVPSGWDEGISP